EIEYAVPTRRSIRAPRVHAFTAVRRTVRRTLKLRLSRKTRSTPSGKRRGLGQTHVDGPGRRQRNPVEHAAPVPRVAAFPEQRMGDALPVDPLQVVRTPPSWLVIPAGLHKLQKTGVGHVVPVNG